MADSSLDKIQKVSVIFTKWFLIAAIILIAAGGAILLYKNSGYMEYKAALAHLNGLTGDDKTNMGDKFFGAWDTQNSFSGILAGSWKYGIAVWGKSGLIYKPFDQNTRFLAIYGCSKENLGNILFQKDKSKQFNTKVFSNFNDWVGQVHAGNYVAFDVTGDNKLISVSAYPEFSALSVPWVFCNITMPEQNPVTK